MSLDRTAGLREKYRVIGVRADQSQHVLAVRLSHHDAMFLTEALLEARIFHAVLVESEAPPATGERTELVAQPDTPLQNDQPVG